MGFTQTALTVSDGSLTDIFVIFAQNLKEASLQLLNISCLLRFGATN